MELKIHRYKFAIKIILLPKIRGSLFASKVVLYA